MKSTCVCIISSSYEEGRSMLDFFKKEKMPLSKTLQTKNGLSYFQLDLTKDDFTNTTTATTTTTTTMIGDDVIKVIVSFPGTSGGIDVLGFASNVFSYFKPSLAIFTGTCAGRRGKVKMCDIIIAEKSIDLASGTNSNSGLEHSINMKGASEAFISSLKMKSMDFKKEEWVNKAKIKLPTYLNKWLMRAIYEYQILINSGESKWLQINGIKITSQSPQDECILNNQSIIDFFNNNIENNREEKERTVNELKKSKKIEYVKGVVQVSLLGQNEILKELAEKGEYPVDSLLISPDVYFGKYGCTSAFEEKYSIDEYGQRVSQVFQDANNIDNDIIAIDRQSFAFYYATSFHDNMDALVIKSVTDYADGPEIDDSGLNSDEVLDYCSRLSTSYALQVIKSYKFESKSLSPTTIHNLRELKSNLIKRVNDYNQDYLTVIRDAFKTHHSVFICGMGGLGKSSLSNMFAHSCVDTTYQYIFWVSCENKEALEQSCSNILENYLDQSLSNYKGDVFKKFNSKLHSMESVLVIYDNLEDERLLRDIYFKDKVNYLITSRSKACAFMESFTIQLGLLNVMESIALFKTYLPYLTDESNSDLEELSRLLECLPLAISQSAKYINQKKISIITYIKLFKEKEDESEDIYEKIINRNIAMVVNQLGGKDKEIETRVRNLLHYLSLLNPDYIDSSIVQIMFNGKDENIHEIIVKLDQYSLLSAEQYLPEKDNVYSITIHRTVQKASLIHLRNERLDVIHVIHQQFFNYLSLVSNKIGKINDSCNECQVGDKNSFCDNCNQEFYSNLKKIYMHLVNIESIIKHYYPTNTGLIIGNQLLNNQIAMFLDNMNNIIFNNLKNDIIVNLKKDMDGSNNNSRNNSTNNSFENVSTNNNNNNSNNFSIDTLRTSLNGVGSVKKSSGNSLNREISHHTFKREISIIGIVENLKKLIVLNSNIGQGNQLSVSVIRDIIVKQNKLNSDELAFLLQQILKNEPRSRNIDIRKSIQLFSDLIDQSQVDDKERVILVMELSIRLLEKFDLEILLSTDWQTLVNLENIRIELLLLYLSITDMFTRDCLNDLKIYILTIKDDAFQFFLLRQVGILVEQARIGDYKGVSNILDSLYSSAINQKLTENQILCLVECCSVFSKKEKITVRDLSLVIKDLSKALFVGFENEQLDTLLYVSDHCFDSISSGTVTLIDLVRIVVDQWNPSKEQIIGLVQDLKFVYGERIAYQDLACYIDKLITIREKYDLEIDHLFRIIDDSKPLIQNSQNQKISIDDLFSSLDRLASSYNNNLDNEFKLKDYLQSFTCSSIDQAFYNYIAVAMFTLSRDIKIYHLSDQQVDIVLKCSKELIINDTRASDLIHTLVMLVVEPFKLETIYQFLKLTKELTTLTKNNIGQSEIIEEIIKIDSCNCNVIDIINQTKPMLLVNMDCSTVSKIISTVALLFNQYSLPMDQIKNIIVQSKVVINALSLKEYDFQFIIESISQLIHIYSFSIEHINRIINISLDLVTNKFPIKEVTQSFTFFSKLVIREKPTKEQIEKILKYAKIIAVKHNVNDIYIVLNTLKDLVLNNIDKSDQIISKSLILLSKNMDSIEVVDIIKLIENENPSDDIIQNTSTLTKLSSYTKDQVKQIIPLIKFKSQENSNLISRIIDHSKYFIHGNVQVFPIISWVTNVVDLLSDDEINLIKNVHLHLKSFPLESLSKFYFENRIIFKQNVNCVLMLACSSTLTVDDYFDLFDLFNSINSETRNYKVLINKREIEPDKIQPISLKTPESTNCHLSSTYDAIKFTFKPQDPNDFRKLLFSSCQDRYLFSLAILQGETDINNHSRLDTLFNNIYNLIQYFKMESNEILFMTRQLYINSFVNTDLLIRKSKEFKKYFKSPNPCNLYLIVGSLSQCKDDQQLTLICRVLELLYSINKDSFCCCYHLSNLIQRLQYLEYTIKGNSFIGYLFDYLDDISGKASKTQSISKLIGFFKKSESSTTFLVDPNKVWLHEVIFNIFNPHTIFNSNI